VKEGVSYGQAKNRHTQLFRIPNIWSKQYHSRLLQICTTLHIIYCRNDFVKLWNESPKCPALCRTVNVTYNRELDILLAMLGIARKQLYAIHSVGAWLTRDWHFVDISVLFKVWAWPDFSFTIRDNIVAIFHHLLIQEAKNLTDIPKIDALACSSYFMDTSPPAKCLSALSSDCPKPAHYTGYTTLDNVEAAWWLSVRQRTP
jgi:hypothetical protein